jgi:hypothetical protein
MVTLEGRSRKSTPSTAVEFAWRPNSTTNGLARFLPERLTVKVPAVAVVFPSDASLPLTIEMIGSLSTIVIVAACLEALTAYRSDAASETTTRSESSANASSTATIGTRTDLALAGMTAVVANEA